MKWWDAKKRPLDASRKRRFAVERFCELLAEYQEALNARERAQDALEAADEQRGRLEEALAEAARGAGVLGVWVVPVAGGKEAWRVMPAQVGSRRGVVERERFVVGRE